MANELHPEMPQEVLDAFRPLAVTRAQLAMLLLEAICSFRLSGDEGLKQVICALVELWDRRAKDKDQGVSS